MMKPGQVVFMALAGGCVVLIASAGLLLGGFGMEVKALAPKDRSAVGDRQGQSALESFRLPPLEEYAVVVERPLFNDDRLPQPDPEVVDPDPTNGGSAVVEPVALNVTVNGIIITPELKVAMITDNATKERLRLRENMPLEGEQGAWVLQRIEPRRLVFEGGGEGPAEVELLTHTKALKGGGPAPARKAAGNKPVREPQPNRKPMSAQASLVQERIRQAGGSTAEDDRERAAKAEEIRRRVAERRAELREEAARRRAEQDDDS